MNIYDLIINTCSNNGQNLYLSITFRDIVSTYIFYFVLFLILKSIKLKLKIYVEINYYKLKNKLSID